MGWRLGGKGASGRNGEPGYGDRIEEHGFHVWMGFYDNAFKMMKDTYAELARKTGPFRTWTDAFKKHSHVVIEEVDQGQRKRWEIKFPTGLREPGTVVRLGLLGYAGRMFKTALQTTARVATTTARTRRRTARSSSRRSTRVACSLAHVCSSRSSWLLHSRNTSCGSLRTGSKSHSPASRIPGARAAAQSAGNVARLDRPDVSRRCRMQLQDRHRAGPRTAEYRTPTMARRMRIFFDLSLAILRGILVDDIIAKGFDSIDRSRIQGLAPPAQCTSGKCRLGDPRCDLRRQFQLYRRRPHQAELRRGRGASLFPENLPRLQGRPALQDAGWHGGRRHRPPV